MLESHSQGSDTRRPEAPGEESRPQCEVAHAQCVFVLTQNPGERWPGLHLDVLRVLMLHQHVALLLQTPLLCQNTRRSVPPGVSS